MCNYVKVLCTRITFIVADFGSSCSPPPWWMASYHLMIFGCCDLSHLVTFPADNEAMEMLWQLRAQRRQSSPELPETVTRLTAPDGSLLYLVGTAHFSDSSKKDVTTVSWLTRGGCVLCSFLPITPFGKKKKKELRLKLLENKWCHLVEVDEGCRVAACSTDEVSRVQFSLTH